MRGFKLVLLLLAALAVPNVAAARPVPRGVQIEIASRAPVFGGESFGEYGPYEKIAGIARMQIDPTDPLNRGIVDLALAPRDPRGLVRYDVDVVILRPIDARKGRRILLYDVVNRGIKTAGMLNGGAIGLTDPIDRGDAVLMRQGVTLVWSGWQGDIAAPGMIRARFPTIRGARGPITGRISTETIFDRTDGNTIKLPYPAATLTKSSARLTVQAVTASSRRSIPATQWRFVDDGTIEIVRPKDMDAGAIYRFEYVAKDPRVAGLGFAATRDLISFLRQGSAEEGNPLADFSDRPCEKRAIGTCPNAGGGAFSTAIAFGVSQSGRYLRDFVWQGFNRDLGRNKVFDGVMAVIPGARRTFTNYRFGEPGRFSRQHEDHDVPGFDFPYAYASLRDPVTGKVDGILRSCTATQSCPQLFHVDTSGEFWQAGASLVGTGGTSRDVALPANVRAYMIAGGAHAPGMTLPYCRYPTNPMTYAPYLRSLFLAMIDWTLDRQAPPPSRWPSLARRELVPVAALRGPAVPGLVWARVLNEPIPSAGRPAWPIFVPAIDADGNDTPGIRPPQVAAPAGTLLGWNLRKAGYGEGDLCLLAGSYLPFAADAATRAGDTRPSLAERYGAGGRATRLRTAADELVRARLLLEEDAATIVAKPVP